MFVGIDPIILFVKDFDLQLAFYRDQVGLKYKEGSYGWAEFDVAGTVFALHGGYKGHVPKENNVAVHFAVNGIQGMVEQMKARGVMFSRDVELQEFGAYNATFEDPEGNRFELIEEAPQVPQATKEAFWDDHDRIHRQEATKGKAH